MVISFWNPALLVRVSLYRVSHYQGSATPLSLSINLYHIGPLFYFLDACVVSWFLFVIQIVASNASFSERTPLVTQSPITTQFFSLPSLSFAFLHSAYYYLTFSYWFVSLSSSNWNVNL